MGKQPLKLNKLKMSGGISKERFHNLDEDLFDCVICQQVVINPKIC